MSDPFVILGVVQGSTEEEVRLAWREKMRGAHPDAGGSHEETIHINQALSDVLKLMRANPEGGIPSDSPTAVRRFARDISSFTVDVLPVESWHALEIVAGQCGSVLAEEPPYLLEFTLHDSGISDATDAWCRCELVPEAGGTTVHVTIVSSSSASPSIETVRDLLVHSLNELDW